MITLSKRHFWSWFRRHQHEYLSLPGKSKKEIRYWLNELNAHLRAYYKFFEFSLRYQKDIPPILTITVNGKSIHYTKVEKFVAAAPSLPGWRFRALEDPLPLDLLYEAEREDTGINPYEYWFYMDAPEQGAASLMVYHPLCTEENKQMYLAVAHAAVFHLLGEKSYGLDISSIEVDNLSEAPDNEIQKLEELPAYIGAKCSALIVDYRGKLMSTY